MLAARNRSIVSWILWIATLSLLGFGFLKPVLRIPVMGSVKFQECHGCSETSALLCMIGIAAGGLLVLLLGKRLFVGIGLGLSALSLVLLLVCFSRLGYYLLEKLSMLSTEGMNLSKVIQPGGFSLLVGLITGVIWWICSVLFFAKSGKTDPN